MKKMLHKIFSILLAACFMLSVVPAPAAAAETTATNGTYDAAGNWSAGGDGSVTYNIDGTDVTLSKTATPVEGMENTFDITLKVVTSTTTTTTRVGGAVVLVLDTSSSMNSNKVDGMTRLQAAKKAANEFLDSYAGTDSNAQRWVAIVTFDGGYRTNMPWTNVAGDPSSAKRIITNLGYDTGTNMDGGLNQALGLLDDSEVSGLTKSVVLLSDGAPTQRINSNWIQQSKENCDAAVNQANAIKNAGAKLYTVCFGATNESAYRNGPTVGNFLSGQVASQDSENKYAYDASDSAELSAAFKAVAESITSGLSGEGWTATDPMPGMIDVVGGTDSHFSGSEGKYTWILSTPEIIENGNTTTYIYEHTYRVVLDVQDPGFEEGTFLPTNERTYLNTEHGNFEFPVPGVKGYWDRSDVTVKKEWKDNDDQDAIRPESVTVQLMEGDRKIGDPVTLTAKDGWTYTWNGVENNLIKQSKGAYHVYTVVEVGVNEDEYKPSVTPTSGENFNIFVTNTHEVDKTNVTVTKVWEDAGNQDGKRPGSIEVVLKADGDVIETVELNEANKWTHTWIGLDKNKAGTAIDYTVDEVKVPAEYEKNITGSAADGYLVTNSYTPETTKVEGSKTWDDNNNRDNIRPDSITINLLADGVQVDSQEVSGEGDTWTFEFDNLPKYRDGGVEIDYTITEEAVEGYTATVDGFNVTNTHTPETVTINGEKTWDDADNQDGKRPSSITIHLMKGEEVVETKTVTAADGWKWSFTNLPKNDAGVAIVYTIEEGAIGVKGYSSSVEGYNVTNSYTPETLIISGTKTWDDADDQDGIRPEKIQVNLLADGVKVGTATVMPDAEGNWNYSFENQPKYRDGGVEIKYEVTEELVDDYVTKVNGFDITNTHTPNVIDITVTKVWNDVDDQAGFRPDSVTVNLLANGEKVDTATITADTEWEYTFEDLPVNAAGNKITYTVTEEAVEHYTTKIEGFTITNTHVPTTVNVEGKKTWVDNDDQDGIRPDSITINLWAGDEKIDSKIVKEVNDWTWSFTDLPEYADGDKIVYTITEDPVENYTTEIDGYNVTNTHSVYKTSVTATKVWNDADNQDGIRSKKVTVRLWAGGEEIASAELSDKNDWTHIFEDLDVNSNGNPIVYSITEDAIEGYTTSIVVGDRGVFTITNTHAPETVEVSGEKTWVDNNDQDGKRPDSITINLLADGEKIDSVTVTAEDEWKWSFTDLPKFKVGAVGEEVEYTITEDTVAGYAPDVDGYDVTNIHEIETTSITVIKKWVDADNQDNIRPESVTVKLMADGVEVATAELKDVLIGDDWTYTFTKLPVYKAGAVGQEIEYTVEEAEVPEGYEATVTGDAKNGYTITNTHEPETVEVTGSKTWIDENNQDGIRPASITIKLLADGKEIDSKTVTTTDDWKWSFTDLPKFKVGEVGKEVKYTVEEVTIDNYSTKVEGFNVTNTHEIFKTEVTVTKVWADEDNQDGIRPESVTVKLMADGVEVATAELKDVLIGDDWTYTFTKLPVYKAGAVGQEIEYTVEEAEVPEGYEATVTGDAKNGYIITNTHEVEKISVKVTKVWDDADNQDGIRPESVTVNIMSNGLAAQKTEVVLSEENEWTYTFEDLDKNAKGKEIKYTVKEIGVPEGYKDEVTGSIEEGFTITNTHTPELIDIDITKKWDDADDQDGKRPESITVNLLANGEVVKTAEVKDTFSLRTLFTDDWTYTFTDLPKYAAGEEIEYTITEEAVEGYEAKINGFTITNTHEPEMTKLDVQKFWKDDNNKEKTRADSVKITLYANGKSTGKTVTLNEKNQWFDSFENLPKYDNGKEIKYTVKEASLALYKASYSYNGTKAVVTNTLSEVPNTGDTSNVGLYLGLMGVCAVAAVALILLNKKKRNA